MSDQIKTQHGTIGLLMAECEQLRRDLAQANENSKVLATEVIRLLHETNAMQTELAQAKNGTTIMQYQSQILHMQGSIAKLKADLARAKAEIERLRQQISSEKVKP